MTTTKQYEDERCLGGTLPHETWTHQDYLAMRDHRYPCSRCKAAGRPIADGTEADAMRVAEQSKPADGRGGGRCDVY